MAFSVGNFTSEFEAKLPSVLLFAVSSLVASAVVARFTSVVKFVVKVFSAKVARFISAVIAVVLFVSAKVARFVSAFIAVAFVASAKVAL